MKISVCIPTYNQANYIGQTIKSVMDQELRPDEIIVSNDHSTDDTQKILDQLSKEIDILKVIHQPVNLGMAGNTDACLKAGTGDLIVGLDSDDTLLPGFIKTLSTLLSQYPEAGYAHADVYEIDEKGNKVKERKLFRKTGFQNADDALKSSVKGYKVAANIIMFRKAALVQASIGIDPNNYAKDFYLSVKIAAAGWGNVYYNDILSCYRVWSDVGQVRQKRKLAEVQGLTAVFNDALSPAFNVRNWNQRVIERSKQGFAIRQASSLGWNIFSKPEKEELRQAILKLSSTTKTKAYISLYISGNGKLLDAYLKINGTIKSVVKSLLK